MSLAARDGIIVSRPKSRLEDAMTWESPSFVDIRMDAEIGTYQEDYDPPNDGFCTSDPPAAE